ncbi:hypothetical protein EVAR_62083_1 [Eumeta japonica]|uniref:Uncharacterized protein n=1 Tax=Eumeta variegata TaxID=151549 RepID=A0A4C1YZ49_EUMVA|nr:hypothetical protein EVAR_62083_1 [Eumeta japonica]
MIGSFYPTRLYLRVFKEEIRVFRRNKNEKTGRTRLEASLPRNLPHHSDISSSSGRFLPCSRVRLPDLLQSGERASSAQSALHEKRTLPGVNTLSADSRRAAARPPARPPPRARAAPAAARAARAPHALR